MTVFQLISKLGGLASSGHGKDKVLVVLSTDKGYVYQELLSIAEYDDERKIGLVGDRNTTDDRREDKEMDNRLTGRYEYRQDGNPARHILIEVKESPSSYTFKLLENSTHLDYDHFILLFKDGDTARVNKKRNQHGMMLWDDGDFTIYPFRAGIPFWFRKVER